VKSSWTWGVPDHDEVVRYVLPLEDGALLVGEAASSMVGGTRGFVMRVGQDGSILWAKDVVSCASDEPIVTTAVLTSDDKIIAGGWHYGAPTRAILFRLEPNGSDTAPAWATETTLPGEILGLEPHTILQLETGELRVVGRWARTSGNDEVFLAGTDSIGRFAWARWYGGDAEQGPPTARITTQGGVMIASTSSSLEPAPGGLWLFEVPTPNGVIDFAPGSGGATDALVFSSAPTCLMTPNASLTTTPLPVGLTSVEVLAHPVSPTTHGQ
jgi:hypothetical protein